ncbi:unconventional myosin-XVIIIa-like [Centruroides vittatus]|uniref:unconventional myosin-XVIIIa-like n=1 Tax=Centruroides vittatus TaxID=120091 RepID=UPI00350EDB37
MFRWKNKEEKKRKDKKDRRQGKSKDEEYAQDDIKQFDDSLHSVSLVNRTFDEDTVEKHSDSSEYSLSSAARSDSSPSASSLTNLDSKPASPTKKPPPVPKKPLIRKIGNEQNIYISRQTSGPNSLTNEVMSILEKINPTPPKPPPQRPPPPPAPPVNLQKANCSNSLYYQSFPGEQVGCNVHWKAYNTDLKLPTINLPKPPSIRTLVIRRQTTGDFGFSLRRAIITDRSDDGSECRQTIVFAEPSTLGKGNETGLLPGDRLLEVNNINVENKSREEIIELIKSSNDSVTLKVQPILELSELTSRLGSEWLNSGENAWQTRALSRSGSRRCKLLAKSDEQLIAEKAWLQAKKVWVIYKGGFASAQLANVEKTPTEGKVWIKLDTNGELIEVDEEDFEKANPPQFDRTEDLSNLRHINESSILFVLRERYAAKLIHTYIGNNMLIINPLHPIAIYSEKVMRLFKGCKQDDMPPHIYSVAQSAYNFLLSTRRDQAIILLGRSGSGKTTNLRHLLQYFAVTSNSKNAITVEKLNAVSTILEAFGNCRTIMNTNATRFTEVFSLDFDHSGQIVSASVQIFMLERTRVCRRPEGEPNFHVFYHLLAGIDESLKKELYLENLTETCLFMTPLQRIDDQQKASLSWMYIKAAMQTLEIQEKELRAILNILAAIYHLGVAGASRATNGRPQFTKPQSAQKAANLLGTTVEELSKGIFNSDSSASLGKYPSSEGGIEAIEALQAIVAGLYGEIFSVLLTLINRSLSSGGRTVASIHIIDSPGFQNPATCGRQNGATLEDFCHNYCQERLQCLFHNSSFLAMQERYAQENISWDTEEFFVTSPSSMINLIEQTPSQVTIRNSNSDLKEFCDRGILSVLDEVSILPGSSERAFIEKIFNNCVTRENQHLIQRGQHGHQFILNHFFGTSSVIYNVTGWIRNSRELPVTRHAATILQDSKKDYICQLFVSCRGLFPAVGNCSLFNNDNFGSLRRTSSIRRAQTVAMTGIKRRSLPLQIKSTIDGLCDMLHKVQLHFVHCLLPQHNAGLCDLKNLNQSVGKSISSEDIPINIPLLRSQVRGAQILDAIRVHKQGFPEHITYSEFRRRFELLSPPEHHSVHPVLDEKKTAEKLLENIDIDKSLYRLGLSKIFLRSGTLSILENQRDDKLNDVIVQFQARCRGYLSRNNYKKLKVQDMAIRCIQRNVRKFLAIHSWSWWRLLVKVLPLLNVHRTEEELRAKTEELENLKAKVEKLEKERIELKHNNDKLEVKVSELWSDLNEEQATSTHVSEMLESEISERMKLEKEVQELQNKCSQIQKKNEHMEMEVMEARTYRPSELNGDLLDDDETSSIYRQKYERLLKELEITKRQMQQQHEEELENQLMIKKASDKKFAEVLEDLEEEKRVSSQWKRKAMKANSEIQDQRLMLEEQMARNAELEKKQRKFDVELSNRQEEIIKEHFLREKVEREKDMLQREKYSLEQELHSTRLDMEMQSEKIIMLNKELEELAGSTSGEEEITQLKRAKQELERKFKDQEEELEELAGQVQLLEQSKLRLEMSLEKSRQELRRELSVKDEEIEEVRAAAQKKVKNLESQLESEQEERHQVLKQKHELERKIVELSDQPPPHDPEVERRLRRDLKRTKALLQDAQMMLERVREGQAGKSIIRQLKNQLEDAEFAKTAAIKARQGAEMELQDLQSQLEEVTRTKCEVESRSLQLSREKNALQTQLEEMEEELAEVMKKYKAVVQQMSSDQKLLTDQHEQITELEAEKQTLKEQLSDLTNKVRTNEWTSRRHSQNSSARRQDPRSGDEVRIRTDHQSQIGESAAQTERTVRKNEARVRFSTQ